MITMRDCYGLCDAVPEVVAAIASHEHLPDILAAEKAYAILGQPWGAPAVRQMILDEYCRAGARGDVPAAEALARLYREARALHPGGHDRRHLPRPAARRH
jgi:hypothetical protein